MGFTYQQAIREHRCSEWAERSVHKTIARDHKSVACKLIVREAEVLLYSTAGTPQRVPPVNTFLYVGNFFAGFECYFFKEEELLGSVLLTVELSTEFFVSLPVKFTHADTVRNSTLACEFTSALWPE